MDTSALVDPATYETGPPFEALRRLRAEAARRLGRRTRAARAGRPVLRAIGRCCVTPTSKLVHGIPSWVLVVAGRHPGTLILDTAQDLEATSAR